MKVRVDFDEPEIGEDPETHDFTAVEFWKKCNTKEQWADAILTFARPAIYSSSTLLAEVLNNGDNGFDVKQFVRRLSDETREELQSLLATPKDAQ